MTELDVLRLNGETIGGIVVGAGAGVLLILFGVFLWWWRRRRRPGLLPLEDPKPPTHHDTGPITPHLPSLPTTAERNRSPTVPSITDPSFAPPPSISASIPSLPQSNDSTTDSDPAARLISHYPTSSSSGSGRDRTQSPTHEASPLSESARPYQAPGYVRDSEKPRFFLLITSITDVPAASAARAVRLFGSDERFRDDAVTPN